MKEIILRGERGVGKIAVVDDEIYDSVKKQRWFFSKRGYAVMTVYQPDTKTNRPITLHRFIMKGVHEITSNICVDHINGNTLDNRLCNLRLCTNAENLCNQRIRVDNKSGYRGVYLRKRDNLWSVQVTKNGRRYFGGDYENVIDAAKAYNKLAVTYHGQFARLNIIPSAFDESPEQNETKND